jgi:uncharacterized protein (TIGR02145 family)
MFEFFMKMTIRKCLVCAVALTTLTLLACGDSSSAATDRSVADKDELRTYACNMDVKGEKVYVSDVELNYECNGEKWIESEDQTKPSSTSAKSSSSGKGSLSSSSVNKDVACSWDFCWSKMSDKIACTQELACTRAYYTPTDDVFLCDYDVDLEKWDWYIYMDLESKKKNYCYNRIEQPKDDNSVYDPETNSLTDLRDNRTYKTLTINLSQTFTVNKTEKFKKYTRVWMAHDLDYKYGSNQSTYTEAQALDSARQFEEVNPLFRRGLCPKGWHIPTWSDFLDFKNAVGDSTMYANDKGAMYYGNKIASYFIYNPGGNRELSSIEFNLTESKMDNSYARGGEHALRCLMDYDPDDIFIDERFPAGVKEDGYYAANCPEGHKCKYAASATYLNKDLVYGEFLDERDDQVYKTIRLGEQTWMAQNLNYADSAESPSLKGAILCGGGVIDSLTAGDCAVHGQRYTWAAATNGAPQGICPEGWHIPSQDEYNALFRFIDMSYGFDNSSYISRGGKYLKSQGGWGDIGNGDDTYGFSVIPTGYYHYNDGTTMYRAFFWSSTENGSTLAYRLSMDGASVNDRYGEKARLNSTEKNELGSIRCLKDSE